MSATIENIVKKCEEISSQNEFIKTLAGKAMDPKWVENDPGYIHIIAVYQGAKAKLVTLVSQLP